VARVSGTTDIDGHLKQLGDAVRGARKAAGLSQEALADAAGIDRSHMGKLERGERNVTLLNIARVAAALDKLPSELLAAAGL
jgi:transcriptional regulator with XRE-family HTH domain